jgi:hypothetical protein
MKALKRYVAAVIFAATGALPANADTINFSYHDSTGLASFYTHDFTSFALASGVSNVKLTINSFSADDRAILFLNGIAVSDTGIGGPGSGSFVFTSGGPVLPYTFT